MRAHFLPFFLLTLLLFPFFSTADATQQPSFQQFVATLQKEARQQGIQEKTIQKYLTGLKAPRTQALYDLHHQAQAHVSFQQYVDTFITSDILLKGRYYMKKYRTLLHKIERRYHVQPQFIIALWGIETDYGTSTEHNAPIVTSLVTLAYQHHRSHFYYDQVMAALKILDHQVLPQQAIGTWDGGMGQASFEPTAYLQYAVDFDRDGFKNIWTSVPDILASIANYLHANGWNGDQPWGIAVQLPTHFPKQLLGIHHKLSLQRWRQLGVHPSQGKSLPAIASSASVLVPNGTSGPAYLVFHNFDVLLRWNNTTFEGLTVGLLSDQMTAQSSHE